MEIFGNKYKARKLGGFRSFIKPKNRAKCIPSTPIIDMYKLWGLMIDDGRRHSIGLKAIVQREFNYKMLEWSEENVKTEQYLYDDVIYLRKLFERFLEKIDGMGDFDDYTLEMWGDIKSQATFTKWAYEKVYPNLKEIQDFNSGVVERENLAVPLERVYNGGITLSLHRGKIEKKTAWVDISGAYVNTIIELNTDKYLQFELEKIDKFPNKQEMRGNTPYLLKIKGNFRMVSINSSLKLYSLDKPHTFWIWSYDILASKNLYKNFEYKILDGYKVVGLNNTSHSLAKKWSDQKNEAKRVQQHMTTISSLVILVMELKLRESRLLQNTQIWSSQE